MLGLLHTWRYGQDVTLELHGQSIELLGDAIIVHQPIINDRIGSVHYWTLLNVDDLLIKPCVGCGIKSHE